MSRRKALQNLFRQSFESSPESRGSQASGVLFGSFCTTQKERKNVPLCRELRGYANLEAAHQSTNFPPQQLKPFSGSLEVLQTSIQLTILQLRINKIKSFHRLAAAFSCFLKAQKAKKKRSCTMQLRFTWRQLPLKDNIVARIDGGTILVHFKMQMTCLRRFT